jgi:5-methylcytosine-specific restriction endonuclease McrA
MRSTNEWRGKTDDSPIPDRVRDRVFAKYEGYCPKCSRELRAGHWQCDHVVPLILGGAHAESNLQPLCTTPCHSAKTALDVKIKAKVARVRKRHLGIRKRSTFACSRDSKFKKKVNGSVVLR